MIIFLGLFAKRKGFIPPEFLGPANRLVYYLAIPAMIFRAISKASLKAQFDIGVLVIALLSVVAVFLIAWGLGLLGRFRQGSLATFVQNSMHGNLGYIGLAVAYYYLGNDGLVRASILTGFLVILQNFLAVFILQLYADESRPDRHLRIVFFKIAGNPIILAALLGILFSLFEIQVPLVLARGLDILSSMALPTALLIIGASLSFDLMRSKLFAVLTTGFMKLMLLPAVGFALYSIVGTPAADYLPGLILLASPTATVSYVMAREMQGDTDFAVAAISTSTLLSAVTFSIWLKLGG